MSAQLDREWVVAFRAKGGKKVSLADLIVLGGGAAFAAGTSAVVARAAATAAVKAHGLIANSRYEIWPASHMMHLAEPEFLRAILDRHRIWAPIGNRVEDPIGSGVWLDLSERPLGSVA